VFEYLFNYTTNLKLLEFANTNNPLLRDLLIKAPGTYHHSMIVGQLAGAGADAIAANSLLARVGSYYHDIGKIGKAQYFIENQQGGINPHDKLNPTMSARILVSHAKDAVKVGRDYKLGKPIIDIIEQHHGTSLMKFFYSKAVELSGKGNVEEQDYRYPGPKPKSREAVLVMIADSCEAACRSLEDPTPSRIKTTVDTIINNMFVDGQFDESNITLKRLKIISQIYTKTLIALHHSRIQYPETHEEQYGDIPERRKWDKVTQKIVDTDGKEISPDTRL
ncbi:MAG: HDIG domain-containing metalloprotein, partial [bacterium]